MNIATTYALGSMDLSFFDDANSLVYLSENERSIYESLGSRTRRRRWIAGRILSKYLILQQHFDAGDSSSQLLKVSDASLTAFSSWVYKLIDIQPSEGNRGYSTVSWNGMATAFDLSISYRDLQVYSIICKGHEVGIDVEKIAERSSAFYRGNYTSQERGFSQRLSEACAIPESWTFTLLWTLKEAAIKSFNSNSISVWDFQSMTVELQAPDKELGELYMLKSPSTLSGFDISYSIGAQEKIKTRAMIHSDNSNILSIVYN